MMNSPFDDFSGTTLNAVPGTLGKLKYVAGLRQHGGNYFHWGMARRHGETPANMAIAEAHTTVFSSILKTPLQTLWEEARKLSGGQLADVLQFLQELQQQKEGLIPSDMRGGSQRHFSSV